MHQFRIEPNADFLANTVKHVLTATSKQWPPVNNNRPNPQLAKVHSNLSRSTSY